MTDMLINNWKERINEYSNAGCLFFFFVSFDKSLGIVHRIADLPGDLSFSISNMEYGSVLSEKVQLNVPIQAQPISFDLYEMAFDKVMHHIQSGDSYLINLTFPSAITIDTTLSHIYKHSSAPYKFLWEDHCVIYSPECFIKIKDGVVSSHPMKGTIDSHIPDARNILLSDEKELAEHYTIVDLIRNDLSIVADHVTVRDFRYVDEIVTNDKILLQTSTKISGHLNEKYKSQYGDLLDALLPAGSISGAPKNKTLEIIQSCEIDDRGLYTGVFGISDGDFLDCGVAIRFIEKTNSGYVYRSGGGITSLSKAEVEYKEMKDKIYVPLG